MRTRVRAAAAVAAVALTLAAAPAGASGARLARSTWHVDVDGTGTTVVDVRDAFAIDEDNVSFALQRGGWLVLSIVNVTNPALAAYVVGVPRMKYSTDYTGPGRVVGTVSQPPGRGLPKGRYRVTGYSDGAGFAEFTASGLNGRIRLAPRGPAPAPLAGKLAVVDDPTGPSPGRLVLPFAAGPRTFAFVVAYASPPAIPAAPVPAPLPVFADAGKNAVDALAACVHATAGQCPASAIEVRAIGTPWSMTLTPYPDGEAWVAQFYSPGAVPAGASQAECDVIGLTAASGLTEDGGSNAFTGVALAFAFAAERQS